MIDTHLQIYDSFEPFQTRMKENQFVWEVEHRMGGCASVGASLVASPLSNHQDVLKYHSGHLHWRYSPVWSEAAELAGFRFALGLWAATP